jgi:hypothetical protein
MSELDLVAPGVATVASASSATTTAISGTTITAAATAAAAIAPVTTTTTATTAAIFVAAAPAPATTAALFARTRFVDTKGASLDLLAVELGHGVLRIGLGCHGDKGKSAGLAGEFILHEQHFGHRTSLRKHVLQLEFRRRERQVAYVQSISHNGLNFCPSPAGSAALKRLQ